MKKVKKLLKSAIFRRLLIVFIIITIPIFLIGLNFYKKNVSTLRQEYINTVKVQINNYLSNLEFEYQKIGTIQYSFIIDTDIYSLVNTGSYMDNFNKTMAIKSLQNKLNAIKSSNDYITEASVYIPSIHKVISAAGSSRYIIDDYSEAFMQEVQDRLEQKSKNKLLLKNEIALIMAYPPKQNLIESKPFFISEIILSKEKIKKDLDVLMSYENGGFYLYDNAGNEIISGKGNERISKQVFKVVNGKDMDGEIVTVMRQKYLVVREHSEALNITLVNYIDEAILSKSIRAYQKWLWLILSAFLVMLLIYVHVIDKYINEPITVMIETFKKLETGNFNIKIDYHPKDEFKVLYKQFNKMVQRVNELVLQVYEQTIFTQRAELKQLQAQINPHFLYNSFFLLHRLIKKKDPNAVEFSKTLGDYFKYITQNSMDQVLFEDEVNHGRIYANMQAMRFAGRIEVKFEALPMELSHILVPKLILQPIIENAFEHGLEDKVKDGKLNIGFRLIPKGCIISIEDNGKVINHEKLYELEATIHNEGVDEQHTGMRNIHRRLQLAFSSDSGLVLTALNGGGLKTDIIIKYKKGVEYV